MAGTGAVVTVACKIANGVILRGEKQVTRVEPVMGGGTREIVEWVATGERIKIHGPARAKGEDPSADGMSRGYALTFGVDADLWARWLENNKSTDMVVNRQIFAHEKQDSLRSIARDHEAVKSGMEPIVPDDDARIPKRVKKESKAA